jgi:2',3'-cyclic-nucleotide 2'-phosphodiesterase (5'-nucleotidase family)
VNVQSFGKEIGRLRLSVDLEARRVAAHQWTRLRVDSRVHPADPDTAAAVAGWEAKLSALLDVPIGRASRDIPREEVRSLVQQALVEQLAAEIGYYTRIGVRAAIPAGHLLARHMWNVSPLDDRAVTLDVTGAQLLALLDPGQPPTIAGSIGAIDPAKRYTVATVDFVAERWAQRDPALHVAGGTQFLADLLIDWTRSRQVIP